MNLKRGNNRILTSGFTEFLIKDSTTKRVYLNHQNTACRNLSFGDMEMVVKRSMIYISQYYE